MDAVWTGLVLLGIAAGVSWAAYLVFKDFEPVVGTDRARIYGALFLVSLPALAVVRMWEMRHRRG